MPGRDLIERVRKALGDRYTVLAAVGRGGNASIFAARDSSGTHVAIKVLHPELAVSVAADRFLREIRSEERRVGKEWRCWVGWDDWKNKGDVVRIGYRWCEMMRCIEVVS